MARCAVVAELCWASRREYPGIWSLVRKLLALLAAFILGYAAISTYEIKASVAAFVLSAERGSEISILVVLAALLAVGLRYNVALGPVERCIVSGLTVFSAFQVLNDSFMDHWMTRHFHGWNLTRVIAFDVALVIWLIPLRRPLTRPPDAHVLLSEDVSRHLLRQILDRMREVTDELKRIGKSIRK
jgi:hypothetical protein